MKKFDIPQYFRSSVVGKVKEARRITDPRKKDFTPTVLDFGPVRFLIARHFGFCYGVENAIERSYRAVEENPDKRIFLLSQMIHNPAVNEDLQKKGIRFIMDTEGNQLIPWDEITPDDVVIVPAFGTTLEIEEFLKEKGVDIDQYDTTCPFVEKVWKRSSQLGDKDYTVVIHGKHNHEETRATFSHSKSGAPSIVIRHMDDAHFIGDYIKGKVSREDFLERFEGRFSNDFDPDRDLDRVGVVNQTTMLATETQAISDHFKQVMIEKYGEENYKDHFADTRDTLCYATNDNQSATYGLLKEPSDLAIVVGGFNSSNTSHLVELCEEKVPTYYINSAAKLISDKVIEHYDYPNKKMVSTENWLPEKRPLSIILTSGASCPDTLVDEVMMRVLEMVGEARPVEEVLNEVIAPAE